MEFGTMDTTGPNKGILNVFEFDGGKVRRKNPMEGMRDKNRKYSMDLKDFGGGAAHPCLVKPDKKELSGLRDRMRKAGENKLAELSDTALSTFMIRTAIERTANSISADIVSSAKGVVTLHDGLPKSAKSGFSDFAGKIREIRNAYEELMKLGDELRSLGAGGMMFIDEACGLEPAKENGGDDEGAE